MRNLYFTILCLFVVNLSKAQIIKEFNINFDTASYELTEKETLKINTIIEPFLSKSDDYSIQIIGHTDNVGDLDYNYLLSNNRAKTISEYIEKKGFKKNKIYSIGRAYLKPTAKNTTEIGKAKNRRVTIKIFKEQEKNNSINGLHLKEDFYEINASKAETIEYKSGTKITIPENAFVDKNGKTVNGIVEISYIEYREPVDFVLGNIPMDYNNGKENHHFNSAGMFKILASQNGDVVTLKEGKSIILNFKTTQELPNLNFYELNSKTKNWVELSKLSQRASYEGGDVVETQKLDTIFSCSFDQCKLIHFIKNSGKKYASSSESIYKQYKLNKGKDSVIITKLNQIRYKDSLKLIKKRDSLFELKNKIKFARINLKISILNKRIEKNNSQIESINQKIGNSIIDTTAATLNSDSKKIYKKSLQLKKVKTTLTNKNIAFKDKIDELNNSKGLRDPIKALHKEKNSHPFTEYYNCFWEENKKYMTITEQSLDIESWFGYFDLNKNIMLERYSKITLTKECEEIEKENKRLQKIAQEEYVKQQEFRSKLSNANDKAGELTKSLSITNLGIFNCDQIQKLKNPIEIFAEYTDENGKGINPVFIYLLDNEFNGIIKYDGYNNFSPFHFAFSPSSKNTLLAFDIDGNSYIFESEKFNKIVATKKNSNQLILKKIENLKSIDDLKAQL